MPKTVNLKNFLDEQPLSLVHYSALAMCAFALLIDGFDIYLVGNLGPAIASHFGVSPDRLRTVFLLQQVGLAVGAFCISPISDRVGRKTVLLGCALIFGALTLASIGATTLLQFAALRGLSGIFLAGVIPNAIALLIELTPQRRQGLFVAIAFTGFGMGNVGGAAVAALLLETHGWQSGFWIGGIVPLVYVLLAIWIVPESVQFLLRRDPANPAIGRMAARLDPGIDLQDVEFVAEKEGMPRKSRLRDVFAEGRLLPTCLWWTIFFVSLGTLGLMLAWMPTLFASRGGVTLEAYSSVATVSLTIALLGVLIIGFVLDRYPATLVLVITFLLVVVGMAMMAHAAFGTAWFAFALMWLFLFQGAGQTALNAVSAQYYPVEVRSTGVGWTYGAGRAGGILGPFVGGAMLAAGFTVQSFFLTLTVPILIVVALIIALDRVNRSRGIAQNT